MLALLMQRTRFIVTLRPGTHTIGLVDSIFDMAAPCVPDARRDEYPISAGVHAESYSYRFYADGERIAAVQSLLYCAHEFMTFEREDVPEEEDYDGRVLRGITPVDGGPGWETPGE